MTSEFKMTVSLTDGRLLEVVTVDPFSTLGQELLQRLAWTLPKLPQLPMEGRCFVCKKTLEECDTISKERGFDECDWIASKTRKPD